MLYMWRNYILKTVSYAQFPFFIVSNWETHFLCHFWWSLWKSNGIKLDFNKAYNPQIDGQTKVVNSSLESLLKCLVGEHLKALD